VAGYTKNELGIGYARGSRVNRCSHRVSLSVHSKGVISDPFQRMQVVILKDLLNCFEGSLRGPGRGPCR
jgi:hypothetical protein